MKIWQKVYLATLVVFLLMLNVGLILGSNYIFEHNVAIERRQCGRECYMLQQNLEHDFNYLAANGRMHVSVIQKVVDTYHNYYQGQNVFIELREAVGDKSSTRSVVIRGGKKIYVQVERTLAKPYSDYSVFYQKELVDFEQTWRKLQATFVIISVGSSLLLCVILFFLIRELFKPLERLNQSVADISAGNYEQNLSAKGEDEIAQLAGNINTMADTIQKQISQLEEENKNKQQLMDNLAHELRTPLTSIYGYAQLLQVGKVSEEETYEGLEYIMKESKRLNKMSADMLSMRLFEKENVQWNKVSIKGVSEHIRRILAETMEKKNIVLRENHQQEEYLGEEDQYIVLFRNLIENAIRASRAGSTVEWSSRRTEKGYEFEVADHGIGMEKDELHKVMQAFYRVDKSRTRAEGGAGLGLSIVETIVTRMGGRIQMESEKDKGTKVTISIELPESLNGADGRKGEEIC